MNIMNMNTNIINIIHANIPSDEVSANVAALADVVDAGVATADAEVSNNDAFFTDGVATADVEISSDDSDDDSDDSDDDDTSLASYPNQRCYDCNAFFGKDGYCPNYCELCDDEPY
jgi:hypothetical protein